MRATITKIDCQRKGTDEQFYMAVYFRMAGGGNAKTHLCRGFRNFKHWDGKVELGAVLDGLEMKTDNIINADSRPIKLPIPKQLPLL